MFYLVRHDRQTFVLEFELNRDRADGRIAYKFDGTFELVAQLSPLSSLAAAHPNVMATYSFEVSGSCKNGCVYVRATKFTAITAPFWVAFGAMLASRATKTPLKMHAKF